MIRLAAILSLIAVALGLLTAGWVSGSLVLVDVSIALAGLALLIWLVAVAIWRENAFGQPAAERQPQRQAMTAAFPEALSPVASAIAGAGRKAKSAVSAVSPTAQQRPVDRSHLAGAPGRERREQEPASRRGDQKRAERKNAKTAAASAARAESARRADDRSRREEASVRGDARTDSATRGVREDTAAWADSPASSRDRRASKRAPDKVAAQSGSTESRPATQRGSRGGRPSTPPFRASRILPGPDIVEPRVPEPEDVSEPIGPAAQPDRSRPSQQKQATADQPQRTRPADAPADRGAGKPARTGDRPDGEVRKPGTAAKADAELMADESSRSTVAGPDRGQSPSADSPGADSPGADSRGADSRGADSRGGKSPGGQSPSAQSPGAKPASADKADGGREAGEFSAAATGSANGSSANSSLVSVVPGIARYHKPECILIRFLGDDDLERMSVQEAEAADCAPCRACRPDRVEATN